MRKAGDIIGQESRDTYSICVGPVHPALKEPVRLNLRVRGERIEHVDFELSQVHRGIEWMGTRRNPIQILYLSERICGICNICHTFAFCRAVESIAGIEVPPRARYIRTIVAELERIHSHILWAGVAAHELGFDSAMHYAFRAREKVLDVIENLTGNRIMKAIMMIGGVRRDMDKGQARLVMEAADFYSRCSRKLEKIFLGDPVIKSRTRDTGILTRHDCLALCSVGPTARASGVRKDVRQDEPYGAYPDVGVKAMTPDEITGETRGDVYDRIAVRLREIKQSADIIGRCVKDMPEGKIAHEDKANVLLGELRGVQGEGIGRHEAPRGEVFHYVKLVGEEAPYSWKVRAPTYNNLLSWIPMMLGAQIADIPVIAASIDPCMSCTNRAVVTGPGRRQVLGQDMLHDLSVKRTRELRRGLRP
ncbi:MAG: nickel-dependent hydrogenase large subunit [Candidatus Aenigmarchaeota archaeon]|nr:nickel-dependent hydrogenase large subunit [Candidatus Aenigmarchaeota archaeon]